MTCFLVSYLSVVCKINNLRKTQLSDLNLCLSHLIMDNFFLNGSCWLSPVSGAIWGFVGPAVAVIGVSHLFMSINLLVYGVDVRPYSLTIIKKTLNKKSRLVSLPAEVVFSLTRNRIIKHKGCY